jgi:hypothetical protein
MAAWALPKRRPADPKGRPLNEDAGGENLKPVGHRKRPDPAPRGPSMPATCSNAGAIPNRFVLVRPNWCASWCLRSWHKMRTPWVARMSGWCGTSFHVHPGSWQRQEGRTMKPQQILIALSVFGLAWPTGATAATLCVGKDYAGVSVEQRSQLETELRKKGGLKAGDQLAACDPRSISATRSAAKKKADPKQANSCKKDCATVSGVAEAVCLIPALAAACIIVKPALKTVCPAACEAQHARSAPQSLSRVTTLE